MVVSGTDVVRPTGQSQAADAAAPTFGPSRGSTSSSSSGSSSACRAGSASRCQSDARADHVFGVVLVNDWSARDIQAWEYQPLGPFLGKSFATSISAWVTPLSLLEEARVEAPPQEPPPLPHLAGGRDWALDIDLEVELNGALISRTNARGLYWTMPQQLAHATSNGAGADGRPDGERDDLRRDGGSEGLIELTRNGAAPLGSADGSARTFLEDGDEVVLHAVVPRTASSWARCGREEPPLPGVIASEVWKRCQTRSLHRTAAAEQLANPCDRAPRGRTAS